MAKIPLPIANGFYKSASLPVSSQECVNLYPNAVGGPALNKEVLFHTPGLKTKIDISSLSSYSKGGRSVSGRAFWVGGGFLYEVRPYLPGESKTANEPDDLTVSSRGAIAGVTGGVSMSDNGTQLMVVVPGVSGYIFTLSSNTLASISDPDFTANGNPEMVEYIDGYFVCITDTNKFIISAINDGTSWDSSDFGTAEVDPDIPVSLIVYNNQLFIAGTQTFEAFENIGGSDFPFQRTGLFFEVGCSARFSLIKFAHSFYWIGGGYNESPAVWRFGGASPEKISTPPIDSLLSAVSDDDLAEVRAWSYAQGGFYFVGFNLLTTTIVYEIKTGRWHERKSYITNNAGGRELTRWRCQDILTAHNYLLASDEFGFKFAALDLNENTEYGNEIVRTFSTQPFQNNMEGFSVPSLELTCESGTGNADTEDPQVEMSRSLDGKTWTAPRARSVGKIGEYDKRQIWYRNGRAARFESFKFTTAAKCKFTGIQLTADIIPNRK